MARSTGGRQRRYSSFQAGSAAARRAAATRACCGWTDRTRPVLDVAQRAAGAQGLELGQAGAAGVRAAQGDGVPGRAGGSAGLVVNGEVADGEAAGQDVAQRG